MDVSTALRRLSLAPPVLETEGELDAWKHDVLRPTFHAWQKVVHPDVNKHDDANEMSVLVNTAYRHLQGATLKELGWCRYPKPETEAFRVKLRSGQRVRIIIRDLITPVRIGVYW